jgi:hypothetical protein
VDTATTRLDQVGSTHDAEEVVPIEARKKLSGWDRGCLSMSEKNKTPRDRGMCGTSVDR